MTLLSNAVAEVTDDGVLVRGVDVPLVLSVDGHYVWSLTPARDGRPARGGLLVPWPAVLRPFLEGRARVRIADVRGEVVLHDADVVLGSGRGRIEIVDRSGHPLCIDKVGHLTRSFEATGEEVRDEILAGTQRALRDLREFAGVEAYLNYGALLGAVREGRMLAHDSDTDVCYLSRHSSPADVITESYAVERVMRERGWSLLRMSGGDIKLLLPLSDGRVCHIDVFVAFFAPTVGAGPFFQLGNRSGDLAREAIVPVSTITLHGYEFPAPADPEAMLAFVYGPHWRVPDPSFRYADPPAGVRRLDGWLRGFRTHMGGWTGWYQGPARKVPRKGSPFARWVHRQLPKGEKIVDLGTGTGRDALFLARRGRDVRAVDFSRASVATVRRRAARSGLSDRVVADQLILGELRSTLLLAARLARDPHHLYARHLLGALDTAATDQLWLLARTALRWGGRLFLEFAAAGDGVPEPEPAGLLRRLDPEIVADRIRAAGGVVEHLTVGEGTDLRGRPDPRTARMRVAWPVVPVPVERNPAHARP
ncbi:class I SAM-dependent methyltransferase [Nocardioides sp. KR10-350]|uniref:SAM-dependent methyltransferase n=1 Tax=Nocardioides cheoyonin TaxID=3156615 RepID=UPI0032B409CB